MNTFQVQIMQVLQKVNHKGGELVIIDLPGSKKNFGLDRYVSILLRLSSADMLSLAEFLIIPIKYCVPGSDSKEAYPLSHGRDVQPPLLFSLLSQKVVQDATKQIKK